MVKKWAIEWTILLVCFNLGQTTRILRTQGAKIAYILFTLLGIPLTVLTLRATGHIFNILVYSSITFINAKIFNRQLTPNIHIKALILNVILFLFQVIHGTLIYCLTQKWSIIDSLVYTVSVVFTISNSREKRVNQRYKMNSSRDKSFRIWFNVFTFFAYTILASVAWSAHHFTRHMRFKAQNQQLAKNGNQCPWVEVTRSHTASPSKSTRERETDRESVCWVALPVIDLWKVQQRENRFSACFYSCFPQE